MSLPGTVFAELPYIPPPYDWNAGWDGLQIVWTGWDGSVWDLSSQEGGIGLKAGVEGFELPAWEHHSDESPARSGDYWRDVKAKPRLVALPMRLWHDDSTRAYLERRRAFIRTLNPRREGVLSVRSAAGTVRTLRCRYTGGWDGPQDRDDTAFGWVDHGPEFTAAQPFWEGESLPYEWKPATSKDFFNAAGTPPGAPDFFISDSFNAETSVITNPGDEDAYPVWTIMGPCTSCTIVANGQSITWPLALSAGQFVRIDTRPEKQTAVNHAGTDVTASLTSWGFAPIPPGANQSFTITLTGGGTVRASLTPLYWSAY